MSGSLRRMDFIAPALSLLAALMLWEALRRASGWPPYVFPGPFDVAIAFMEDGWLFLGSSARTLGAAAAGFAASIAVGLGMALLFVFSPLAQKALKPWTLALQMTPVITLAPILVIWLGEGFASVAAIAFVIGFFPIAASATQGMLSVRSERVELFRLWSASRRQEVFLLRLPASLPYILTGAKISASLAVIGALTGEFFAGTVSGSGGLGYLILAFRQEANTPALFATAGLSCALGFLFVGAVSTVRRAFLRLWPAE